MTPQIYKATFRKKDDGLAISSHKGTKDEVSSWIANETRLLLAGDVAPGGFTIEVVPVEC